MTDNKTMPEPVLDEDGDLITTRDAARALLCAFRASPTSHQTIGYRSDLWTVLAECLAADDTASQLQAALDRAIRAAKEDPHGGKVMLSIKDATAAEAALAEARKVIEALARLQVPTKPQGNAGAYSIFHSDIRAARQWLSAHPAKETKNGN